MKTFAIPGIKLDGVQSRLDQAVDCCFLAMLFGAPLLMGGRHPLGQLGYVALISLTAIVWMVRQAIGRPAGIRRSGAEWLILLILAVPLVQLIHLPHSWLVSIAPNLPHFLPSWFDGQPHAGLESWSQLSLYPNQTRVALIMGMAYATWFLLVIQRIKSIEDIERILRWIALAAVSLAVLGIVQMLLSNGKFLWIYAHPSRDTLRIVKGPFANENHFAHFLALGVGPLVWRLWSEMNANSGAKSGRHTKKSKATSSRQTDPHAFLTRRRPRSRSVFFSSSEQRAAGATDVQMLTWLALPIIAIAGLLTFSRGGVIVLGVAALFVIASYLATKLFGRKSLFALAGLATLVAAALLVHGLERLSGELESVTSASIDQLDTRATRRTLWEADWKAFRDFSVLGTGAATHREVYPAYFEEPHHVEFTHAESGYVQIMMECGTAGVCLLLVAIGLCIRWSWRCLKYAPDKRTRAVTLAILTAIVASLVHSIWDFVWYIPACLTLTLVLVACLCRTSQLCRPEQRPKPAATGDDRQRAANSAEVSPARTNERKSNRIRVSWALAACVVALGSFQILGSLLPAAKAAPSWDRYAQLVSELKKQPNAEDASTSILAALPDVERAWRLDPDNARVSLKLAALYLQQFEHRQQTAPNPMTVDQIREAVIASGFSSREELEQWLDRAVGPHRSLLLKARLLARRAATLSPMQGEAYVHLSQLEFLYGGSRESSDALMSQALRVRPHHGGILVAAATDAVQNGNFESAMNYFRRAFGQGVEHQQQIIETLAGSLPPDYLLAQLQPDLGGLRQLFRHYRQAEQDEAADVVAGPLVQALRSTASEQRPEIAARLWHEAHLVYGFLEDHGAMLDCLQQAVELRPNEFGFRKRYALELALHAPSDKAIAQIRWCLQRKPNDSALKQAMIEVTGKNLRNSSIAEATEERSLRR